MMAKKDRYPPGYSATFGSHYESEGMAGCSGRVDSVEDTRKKWVDLNSASKSGFAVPVQVIPVSKLSPLERKNMVLRLTSELAQIRLIQNKIEFQKQTVGNAGAKSSSSDIVNYQQKVMQIGNPRKQHGLGSGPGKKGSVLNRAPGTKNTRVNANVGGLLKQCESLLKKLMSQQYAWVFNTPVDAVKLSLPDYFDVIKNPMDLGTVKKKITSGKYSCPLDFLADVRLTFTNAKTYNLPGSDVHVMADAMSQFFELRWKVIDKKVVVTNTTTQSLPGKCGIFDETEINKPSSNPSKKRKVSPRPHEVIREPVNPRMTDAEKSKLSSELEYFIGDLPDSIIDFLKAHTTSKDDSREDEIEIDIDDLSDDALFTLRKLLDDHSQEKNKSFAKSEACEIELPYVSGLSNSSLHVDKVGNDPIDEDVDIGGNEAPVTSYHPVLIEKDIGGRAEECNEAGPEFEGGSECSKVSSDLKQLQDDMGQTCESDKKDVIKDLVGRSSGDQGSQLKPCSSDSDGQLDGESAQNERQMSPDKLYRAALLKNRFADTILKAREKTQKQDEKADPEKLRREKEQLEMHMKREKARLEAEAKAAEEGRRRAEAEAAAEAKRRREMEREAARDALLKMEKTVDINESSRFLHDLEMQMLPSCVDDGSPEKSLDGFGNFKFGSNNALEQLGLYMKVDDEEEEGEGPPSISTSITPPAAAAAAATGDVEEGEID